MRFDSDRIEDIIVRSLTGCMTPDDRRELDFWLEEDPAHRIFYERVITPVNVKEISEQYRLIDVQQKLQQNRRMLLKRRVRRIGFRAAACAAVVLLFFGIWLLADRSVKEDCRELTSEATILAGKKQAELILANGRRILLGETAGASIQEQGSEIKITAEQIDYEGKEGGLVTVYNIMRTPRGGEYKLTLADGSVVWLNAASELIYPVSFNGDTREVTLKGEAYFQVKRDEKRKFIVHSGNYHVRVLGTTFNINAYPEDNLMRTTLCSGKVLVTDGKQHAEMQLEPGEQLVCDASKGTMSVINVDSGFYTAWTRGRFQFDNTSIEDMFTVLSRWYDIDVFYSNSNIRENVFTGDLPRFDDLKTLLGLIEQVCDVRFEVKGRTLIIK